MSGDASVLLVTQLLEAFPDPVLLFDVSRRLTGTNAASRALLDVRDAPFTPTQALGTARLADLVEEAAAEGGTLHMDTTFEGWELEGIAAPVGDHTLLLLRDQTDRSRRAGRKSKV